MDFNEIFNNSFQISDRFPKANNGLLTSNCFPTFAINSNHHVFYYTDSNQLVITDLSDENPISYDLEALNCFTLSEDDILYGFTKDYFIILDINSLECQTINTDLFSVIKIFPSPSISNSEQNIFLILEESQSTFSLFNPFESSDSLETLFTGAIDADLHENRIAVLTEKEIIISEFNEFNSKPSQILTIPINHLFPSFIQFNKNTFFVFTPSTVEFYNSAGKHIDTKTDVTQFIPCSNCAALQSNDHITVYTDYDTQLIQIANLDHVTIYNHKIYYKESRNSIRSRSFQFLENSIVSYFVLHLDCSNDIFTKIHNALGKIYQERHTYSALFNRRVGKTSLFVEIKRKLDCNEFYDAFCRYLDADLLEKIDPESIEQISPYEKAAPFFYFVLDDLFYSSDFMANINYHPILQKIDKFFKQIDKDAIVNFDQMPIAVIKSENQFLRLCTLFHYLCPKVKLLKSVNDQLILILESMLSNQPDYMFFFQLFNCQFIRSFNPTQMYLRFNSLESYQYVLDRKFFVGENGKWQAKQIISHDVYTQLEKWNLIVETKGPQVSLDELYNSFKEYGIIYDIHIITNTIALVQFKNKEAALQVKNSFNDPQMSIRIATASELQKINALLSLNQLSTINQLNKNLQIPPKPNPKDKSKQKNQPFNDPKKSIRIATASDLQKIDDLLSQNQLNKVNQSNKNPQIPPKLNPKNKSKQKGKPKQQDSRKRKDKKH